MGSTSMCLSISPLGCPRSVQHIFIKQTIYENMMLYPLEIYKLLLKDILDVQFNTYN